MMLNLITLIILTMYIDPQNEVFYHATEFGTSLDLKRLLQFFVMLHCDLGEDSSGLSPESKTY